MTEETSDIEEYLGRVEILKEVSRYAGLLSGISVGGTFVYMYKLLK
jgi:hypothetical protein